MNPGRLDRQITIYIPTATRNTSGDNINGWASFCTSWAMVKPGQGSEGTSADRTQAEQTTIFTIRYRSDINEKMRIVYEGENYNIVGKSEIVRKQYLQLIGRVAR